MAGNVEILSLCFSYDTYGISVCLTLLDGAVPSLMPSFLLALLLYLSHNIQLAGHPGKRRVYDQWEVNSTGYTWPTTLKTESATAAFPPKSGPVSTENATQNRSPPRGSWNLMPLIYWAHCWKQRQVISLPLSSWICIRDWIWRFTRRDPLRPTLRLFFGH